MSFPTEKPATTVPTVDANEDIIDMNLASSSRPDSVAGSDGSDTAAGSVVSEGGNTDAIVVPYSGPPGHVSDTVPKVFSFP